MCATSIKAIDYQFNTITKNSDLMKIAMKTNKRV